MLDLLLARTSDAYAPPLSRNMTMNKKVRQRLRVEGVRGFPLQRRLRGLQMHRPRPSRLRLPDLRVLPLRLRLVGGGVRRLRGPNCHRAVGCR